MTRPGIEPGTLRSKSKRATIELKMLYVMQCNFLPYKVLVNKISKSAYKVLFFIPKAKVDFYKVKAMQKTFFEGRPLVITPLC